MAWKEIDVFEQRCQFVLLASQVGVNKSRLCREFGISRPTGDKWLLRYEEGGLKALHDEPRRPKNFRDETPGYIRDEVYRLRNEHPSWGGRTIRAELLRQGLESPCARTIDRLLKRAGFVKSSSRKRRVILPENEIVKPNAVNDVWTVDFKGWWLTRDGKRCEPLTIRDEYSRFVLGIVALPGTKQEAVKSAFERTFRRYGLPRYIRSDNGSPFACTRAVGGLSKLSAWWLNHGITPDRIKPASPHLNGAHERFHRDMKRELQQSPAAKLDAEQRRFDRWRRYFNEERPHHALSMKTPAEVYKCSQRKYKKNVPAYIYPAGMEDRLVDKNGCISIKHKHHFLSKALYGERVGLDCVDGITQVWFRDFLLGVVSPSTRKILPLANPIRDRYSQDDV